MKTDIMLGFNTLYLDVEANTTASTDLEPVISYDHVNRLTNTIETLRKLLMRTRMKPMPAGTTIRRYKKTVTKGGPQPAEGDIIPLTKVERKELAPIVLELKPIRKLTTAQAIQKVGKKIALNETDEAVVGEAQKDVRDAAFKMITADTATAADPGTDLQDALGKVWAKLADYYKDVTVTPVYFISTFDAGDYIGKSGVGLAQTFGLYYLENFMGIGDAIFTPFIPKGTVYATAKENMNGAYVPESGDVSDEFGLTYDESGMVGMTHSRVDERAAIQTLIMYGVVFYPEDAAGIIKGTIAAAAG